MIPMTMTGFVRMCLMISTTAAVACGGNDLDTTEGATEGASADGGDDGASTGGTPIDGIAAIEGYVTSATGEPLADVTVASPDAETTTDASGHFVLETQSNEGTATVVTLSKDGWVRGHERVTTQDGAVNVLRAIMVAEAPPVMLDASVGGSATGMRNASVVAAPGAFVRGDGTVVEGQVQVHLTALNPAIAGEYDAYPGDGLARDQAGELVQLETFGVLDVTVRQDGEELNIADGMTIEVQIPLPDPAPAVIPETMPLWSFDEEAGVWAEEGMLTLDLEAGVYRGELPHLSPWNADQALTATCVRGRAQDADGNALAGSTVFAQGVDYLGGGMTNADANGEFCVAVRKDSTVEITVYGLDGSTARTVESGDADVTMPLVCDEACLDAGAWTLIPGEGDPSWGGGVCEPPDEDTWLSMDFGGALDFSLDLSADDPNVVACGFHLEDPAPGPGEASGATYMAFVEGGNDGWQVLVFVERGVEETGSFEGVVVASPNDPNREGESVSASCLMSVGEANEVDDDVFVVGGDATCDAVALTDTGFAQSSGNVDFRGVVGRFDGVIPMLCCDDAMLAGLPGMP